jgi:hypothetical protein
MLIPTHPQTQGLQAAAALENPSLVGQPALQEDITGPDMLQPAPAQQGGIYMGAYVAGWPPIAAACVCVMC